MQNDGTIFDTGAGWRLVCHNCGMMFEKNMAINPNKAGCCGNPDLHIHDLRKPCGMCTSGNPIT